MFSTIENKNGWILCAKVVFFFLVSSALLLSFPFAKVNGQNLDELEEILREVRDGGDVDVEYSEEHIEVGVVERMQLENNDMSEDEVFTQTGNGEATKESFSIESPKQGETVVNTNLSLTGKAPRGTLVHINIKDEDTDNRWMKHLPVPFINGTVTSDESGNWVFIPQQTLVPGYYSVVASYNNPVTGTVSSERLYFNVADAMGRTKLFKIPPEFIVVTTILVFIVASFLVYIYLKNRKRLKEQERFVEGELVEGPRQPPSGLPAPGHYQPVQPQFQSPVPQQMNEPNVNPQAPVYQMQVNEPIAQPQIPVANVGVNEPQVVPQQTSVSDVNQNTQTPNGFQSIANQMNEPVVEGNSALPKEEEVVKDELNPSEDLVVGNNISNLEPEEEQKKDVDQYSVDDTEDPEEMSKKLKETINIAAAYEKKILSSAQKAERALKNLQELKKQVESDEPAEVVSDMRNNEESSDGFNYKNILEDELGTDSVIEDFGLKKTLTHPGDVVDKVKSSSESGGVSSNSEKEKTYTSSTA